MSEMCIFTDLFHKIFKMAAIMSHLAMPRMVLALKRNETKLSDLVDIEKSVRIHTFIPGRERVWLWL